MCSFFFIRFDQSGQTLLHILWPLLCALRASDSSCRAEDSYSQRSEPNQCYSGVQAPAGRPVPPAWRLPAEPDVRRAFRNLSDELLSALESLQRHGPAAGLDQLEALPHQTPQDKESREIRQTPSEKRGWHPPQSHAAHILTHGFTAGSGGQGQSTAHGREVQVLI